MVQKYNKAVRILHWLMAIIIISLLILGWFMTNISDDKEYKWTIYWLHKSFGVTIIFLFLARIITRNRSNIPDLPERFSKWIKAAAKVSHYILYLLMILMPMSGYLMSSLNGYNVKLFSINLPNFLPENKALAGFFHAAHGIIAYIISFFILLHFLGAMKHLFIDKYNILKRIL